MWINPLDKVPQFRSDWANHIVYGGLGSIVVMAALHIRLSTHFAVDYGFYAMLALATLKKAVDFIKVGPPTESLLICVGKVIATVLWPASLAALNHLK
jgi:hypothetical protein